MPSPGEAPAQWRRIRHGHTVNRGTHTIHTGGRFDSHLLAPDVRTDATA